MIVLFRGTGPIASAIRWQTRGEYAHAAWLCADGTCIESHGTTGVARQAHPWMNNSGLADVYSVNGLTQSEHDRIEAFHSRRIGAGYDWLGVARFLSGINRNNMERWFCSELVAEACEMAGRPLLRTEGWRISPTTLSWSTEISLVKRDADFAWWADRFLPMEDVL